MIDIFIYMNIVVFSLLLVRSTLKLMEIEKEIKETKQKIIELKKRNNDSA